MKLLQILYPGLGGHASVAFSLIDGDSSGDNSNVLIGYGIEQPSEPFKKKSEKTGTRYYSILKKSGFDFASQIKIFKLLKSEKPDAIIMHSTAVVFSVFFYSIFNKVKWISVEHQSNFAKSKKDWFYTFFILLLSPIIVYLSEDYKKQIKSKFKFIFPSQKVSIIHNGIDTDLYRKSHDKLLKPNLVHLAMISRFNPLRDHETLIKAIIELRVSNHIKLSIAGDGDTKKEMEQLVIDLGLNKEIEFLGIINESEIIELLQRTDIYVHSSLAETQSTSILQVMASKTPIVATNIPGINNVIRDGYNGLLFETKKVNQLVQCIARLIADLELKSQLVNCAYEDLKKQYSISDMFKTYSDLWNK